MPVRRLTSSISTRGDVVVVSLSGEIDLAEVDHVDDLLTTARALARSALVVDLSGVAFLDGYGVASLSRALSLAGTDGTSLALAAPSRAVRRTLTLLGLDGCFPVFATVREALLSYRHEGLSLIWSSGDSQPSTLHGGRRLRSV